jgi:glycosyltransferase involved in cell wall biosynthesis
MISDHEHPLVSVIIPTFNRAWILLEAIESVLSQTFENYELIVVDDGSTDNTRLLLKACKDIRVVSQENKGVSAARNRGIEAATGDYLAFLDSDDLWLPEKLDLQMAFFKTHPKAMICQTQETWIRNGKRINPKKRHRKASGMFFDRSLALCLVSPSAVIIKKELLEDVGQFDEDLPACEDYDLWLRIGARYPMFLVDEALVIKRGGHADQLSALSGLDKYRIQSLKKLLGSNMLTNEQRVATVAMLQKKCEIYAAGCMKRGKKEAAGYYRGLAERYGQEQMTNDFMEETHGAV